MKYISDKEIAKAWSRLIDSNEQKRAPLNKFFGLLEVIGNLKMEENELIKSGVQYELNTATLSNALQAKYFFGAEVKDFNSLEFLYVVFPNNWSDNVFNTFLKSTKISIKDAAILCLQNTQFKDTDSKENLKKQFISEYHLSNVTSSLFSDDNENIEFQDKKPDRPNIFKALKKKYGITDSSKFTFGFEPSVIAANPGELTRGPFIQPLYSGQENLKCVLIAAFNFIDNYKLQNDKPTEKSQKRNTDVLNRILYGPPGTGKTHNAINHALSIIKGDISDLTRTQIKKEYDDLVKEGKIQFVTFHQSYSYEEFVEGIKPTINQKGEVEYNIKDGVFKNLCIEAGKKEKYDFEEIYDDFVSEVKAAQSIPLKTSVQKKDFTVHVDENGNIYAQTANSQTGILKEALRNYLDKGTVPPWWGSYIRSVGDYFKTKYATKIHSIDNSKKKFVLIIDEINRGNISKIFGELITLIEESKRIGEDEALTIKLTYSGSEGDEVFGVPNNLYIIGTMNTADRSIALIDTALRRRFTFFEHTFDQSELSENAEGINVKLLVSMMNKRIEFLLDKDHLLGHAYFLGIETKNALCGVFRNKVIPLLEEYFYGDYEKIQLVFGDNKEYGKSNDNLNRIVIRKQASEQTILFGKEVDGFEEKSLFEINEKIVNEKYDEITTNFFTSIYTKTVKEG